MSKEMIKLGHEVHFLCPSESIIDETLPQHFHLIGKNLVNGLKGIGFELSVKKHLPKLLDKINPNIVLFDWRGAIGGLRISVNKEYPCILIDRGPPAYPGVLTKIQWILYRKSWRKAKKYAKAAFVVSPQHKKLAESIIGNSLEIIPIPAGIDQNSFNIKNQSTQDKELKFVYHGRLDKRRRIELTVEFVGKLKELGINASLNLIGEGDQMKELELMSDNREWMNMFGKVKHDEIPKILSTMDIGLLPMGDEISWVTASPIKLFEFAASGLVVIATNIEAHKLENSESWLRNTNLETFVEDGVNLIQDKSFIDNIKQNGRTAQKQVLENHTWEKSALKMLEVIDIHQGQSPP
jgi:glycosyltransferase involved in cell wall biosynthesis